MPDAGPRPPESGVAGCVCGVPAHRRRGRRMFPSWDAGIITPGAATAGHSAARYGETATWISVRSATTSPQGDDDLCASARDRRMTMATSEFAEICSDAALIWAATWQVDRPGRFVQRRRQRVGDDRQAPARSIRGRTPWALTRRGRRVGVVA